jgi:uncharacterized YccA/Bax inhibitor family protein|tara:strand:- start:336 stop:1103 length:768 start_codon:yes stop_codon:yes gene_type:complete
MNQKQALQTFGRSGNPMFSDQTFSEKIIDVSLPKMTLQGTVNKVGISLLLVLLTAAYTWNQYFSYGADAIGALTIGGSLVGFVFALITIFKRTWAPVTAPLYALAKGFALGGISAMYEAQFAGITIQAVTLTFATMFGLLFAYKTGIIKPDQNFRLMLFSATFAVFAVYMLNIIMMFFGTSIGFIHDNGLFGIGFSLVVVCIAALNLVLDFDYIEQGAEAGAPKYLEWYGAFSLMVTLIWLYLEILRLLTKLRSR